MPEFYYRLHFPIFLWRHFSRCSAQPTHFVNQFSPLFFPFLPPNPCMCMVHWPFKYNSWGGQLRWQLGWSWTWSWWWSRLVWVTLDRVSVESCFEGNQMLFSKQFKDHRNRKSLNVCKHKYSYDCGCLPMPTHVSTRVYPDIEILSGYIMSCTNCQYFHNMDIWWNPSD